MITLAKPSFGPEELTALERVLKSGWVAQGKEVEAFEYAVAKTHQAQHGVAVTSATAGLHLACLALEIGEEDLVFIPSFAWPSAANMAVRVNARPVLVDVRADTYNLCPDALRTAILQARSSGIGNPKAIIIVHEFGLAADMNALVEIAENEGLEIIEDAACAFGANYGDKQVGTFGKLGVFSFHPRKSITTGEGGMVVTNDSQLAERIRILRNHGQTMSNRRRQFLEAGFNYRLTDIQAAIGNVQLTRFPNILSRRRQIATWYHELFGKSESFELPGLCTDHTWQTFMIVVAESLERDTIISTCRERGLEVALGSVAAHASEFFQKHFGYENQSCPISQRLFEKGLALPMHADLTQIDCETVVKTLKKVVDEL